MQDTPSTNIIVVVVMSQQHCVTSTVRGAEGAVRILVVPPPPSSSSSSSHTTPSPSRHCCCSAAALDEQHRRDTVTPTKGEWSRSSWYESHKNRSPLTREKRETVSAVIAVRRKETERSKDKNKDPSMKACLKDLFLVKLVIR
ncbi:hypothetical protein BHE74_00034561 [Ensete ventricosum]|nr:hypothetical protein BHE74_00034561 [Ensete ventricosum]